MRAIGIVGEIDDQHKIHAEAPRGIYAIGNVSQTVTQETKANPSLTPEALDAYLATLYSGLLANRARTVQVHWSMLNPRAPSDRSPYDLEHSRRRIRQCGGVEFPKPRVSSENHPTHCDFQLSVPPMPISVPR